jgi:hypothetical protein
MTLLSLKRSLARRSLDHTRGTGLSRMNRCYLPEGRGSGRNPICRGASVLVDRPGRPIRTFGAQASDRAQSGSVSTVEQERHGVDDAAVFDWRFGTLLHAGFSPDQAWTLAACKNVDVRLAERLLAQGCPQATAVLILL